MDLDRRVAELGMRVTGSAHLSGGRLVARLLPLFGADLRVDLLGACGEAGGADFQRRPVAVEHDVVRGGVIDIDAHQGLDARAHFAVMVAHASLRGHRSEVFRFAHQLDPIVERPDDADLAARIRRAA